MAAALAHHQYYELEIHMHLNDVTKWVTLAGAVIGGITGALTYWSKIGERRDNIKIRFGALRPVYVPGYALYVLSRSDHVVTLADFGFISKSGRLLSLPDLWEDSFGDENEGLITAGRSILEKRGETWEVYGQQLRDEQIGAYAVGAGQIWRRIDFRFDVPIHTRLLFRFRIMRNPQWQ